MVHIQDLPIELLKHILSFIADPHHDESSLKLADRAIQKSRAEERAGNEVDTDDEDDDNDDDDDDDDDDEDDEVENLRNVCLVSQVFRKLAQPLLFHDFEDDGLCGDIRKTISFTRSIYRNPDLGRHVQCVTMAAPIPFDPNGPRRLDAEDSLLFKSAIKDLRLGDQEDAWITAIQELDLSIVLAVLVNKTPNLRELFLPGGQFSPQPFNHLFNQNPSFLSSLEFLWIDCEDEFFGYDIASYERFLTLPKLVFATFEYGDLEDASFPFTWTPGTLAIERVGFHHCHIDAGAIQKFMQACKKVKSFTYENFSPDLQGQRSPSRKAANEFNAMDAHKAALLHKDSLEFFNLAFSRLSRGVPNFTASGPVKIGSFNDFSVLDCIYISHALLPSHPHFPPSLETLHITDCNTSIRDMVQKIATDCKKGLYPNFAVFRVLSVDVTQPIRLPGQRIPPGKTPAECFLSLQEMFKGTKVDFMIAPYEIPDFDQYDDSDLDGEEAEQYIGRSETDGMPGLINLIMQRALQDPGFAPFRSSAESENSWESDSNG